MKGKLDLGVERIPTAILTGFLGSGKTTLLNRLLRHPGMANTAVIVNEFGEVGLDHLIVETPDESMVLMNSGCLCCSILGDLVQTLQTLLARRVKGEIPPFERVVIETTGVADPAPILHTLISDGDVTPYFTLDSVITLVDAVNGLRQFDSHFEPVKQAAIADRIVISKTDLVEESDLIALRARLAEVSPRASVHQAVLGEIEPDKLFGAGKPGGGVRDVGDWLEGAVRDGEHGHGRDHDHGHRHDDGIRTFTVFRDEPVSAAGLQLWLDMMASFRGPNLLRVKGLLNVDGRPVVVHAVQHLFHPPVRLDAWPDADRRSRLVFITHGIGREDVADTLAALDFRPVGPGDGARIDPANYAGFLSVIKRFDDSRH